MTTDMFVVVKFCVVLAHEFMPYHMNFNTCNTTGDLVEKGMYIWGFPLHLGLMLLNLEFCV